MNESPQDEQAAIGFLQGGFLQGFDDADLAEIAEAARVVDVPAGKVVFREGEAAKDIFLVLEGRVALEICAPSVGCKRLMTVGEGELLGWSPLLDGPTMTATARASTASRMAALDAGKLRALFERHPRIGYLFMRRTAQALARRLNAARLQFLDVYGSQMAEVGRGPFQQGGGNDA